MAIIKRLSFCVLLCSTAHAHVSYTPSERTDIGHYYGRVPTGVGLIGAYKLDHWVLQNAAKTLSEKLNKSWLMLGVGIYDTFGRNMMIGGEIYGSLMVGHNSPDENTLAHTYQFSRWQFGSLLKFGYCFPRTGLTTYVGVGRNHIRGVPRKQANNSSANDDDVTKRTHYLVWRFQAGVDAMISRVRVFICYEFQKLSERSCYSNGMMVGVCISA